MPKTLTGTPRRLVIGFRVKPAERALIEYFAARADQPVSEYLREAAREYGRSIEAGGVSRETPSPGADS